MADNEFDCFSIHSIGDQQSDKSTFFENWLLFLCTLRIGVTNR